jgi:spore maturation protein CgeB
MRVVMFYHSLRSDWNHGNAHFLRGIVRELKERGHTPVVYEPRDAWSVENLVREQGEAALDGFRSVYRGLDSIRYDLATLDLEAATDGADLVIVHEWSDHGLVAGLGALRRRGAKFRLLFHDTHHRAITDRASMAAYDLSAYDGVLAFGEVLRALYLREGWAARAWTFHEAADTKVFRPYAEVAPALTWPDPNWPDQNWPDLIWPDLIWPDLIWIGNWGDDERSKELDEFLIAPVAALGLRARIHGVRYPDAARAALASAGIEYGGWLPNHQAPAAFARARVTVHVPRRPYAEALPGIPTIRVFEALACGIPLVSAPWSDAEGLFTPGRDYLVAKDGAEMRRHLRAILDDRALARSLADHGLRTIAARHTCAHRVTQLLEIAKELGVVAPMRSEAPIEANP